MELISILLPTRGRVNLAERFLTSANKTATYPNHIEYVIYTDEDDPESLKISAEGMRCVRISGPRTTMGACNTRCLEASSGEIIILSNDDVVINTIGWDEKIRNMHRDVGDKIYLAYPNDLYKGESLSAFPILSRTTCDFLDQPFPEIYKGAFIDVHLMEIFIRLRKLGCDRIRYMPDVEFEHVHFRTGKSKIDKTYIERDRYGDDYIFHSLHLIRKAAARFLAKLINGSIDKSPKFRFEQPEAMCKPMSLFGAIKILARIYLLDRDLPFWFKLRSFFYYTARWLFSVLVVNKNSK